MLPISLRTLLSTSSEGLSGLSIISDNPSDQLLRCIESAATSFRIWRNSRKYLSEFVPGPELTGTGNLLRGAMAMVAVSLGPFSLALPLYIDQYILAPKGI